MSRSLIKKGIQSFSSFVLVAVLFGVFAPGASAVNGMFECWCTDSSTNVCNHYRIDSGIAATDSVWPFRYPVAQADGSIAHSASVATVVGAMDLTPARREELLGLCNARCAADSGKRAIYYETTYREEVCSECNADPNSSCTEERGARLAFGEADAAQKIAACEERQAQSLLPMRLAIPIGGITEVSGLPDYINVAYRYLVTIVLVVAIVMVVYGGFRYLVGASLGDVQAGKKIIIDAIVGMMIVLGAHMILSTVNPNTTELSLAPPTPIECRDLALPNAVKNSRCSSDTDCPTGQRCIEGGNYIFSGENVMEAAQGGAQEGAEIGGRVAESGGVLGFLGDGVTSGQVAFWGGPLGALGLLLSSDAVRESGAYEATGAVIGSALSRDAQIVSELISDYRNIKVCSTGEQGAPCLEDQACRAGLTCMESWSICWPDSGNRPGQPCDTDEQCSNDSCVDVSGTEYKVCEIQVRDSTPCFRPNNGISQTVFPIQCNGAPMDTEFVCVWCPGPDAVDRTWTPLLPTMQFPAQCKPRSVLSSPTPCTR